MSYVDYKKWYWGLSEKFNPVNFNPNQWSDVMEKAGMKYAIFTTKHHDGFNMFDTKQTNFSTYFPKISPPLAKKVLPVK